MVAGKSWTPCVVAVGSVGHDAVVEQFGTIGDDLVHEKNM